MLPQVWKFSHAYCLVCAPEPQVLSATHKPTKEGPRRALPPVFQGTSLTTTPVGRLLRLVKETKLLLVADVTVIGTFSKTKDSLLSHSQARCQHYEQRTGSGALCQVRVGQSVLNLICNFALSTCNVFSQCYYGLFINNICGTRKLYWFCLFCFCVGRGGGSGGGGCRGTFALLYHFFSLQRVSQEPRRDLKREVELGS